ncbi:MAG: SLAC1 anion channel family protein [Gammaproteobacteria bacterium]|nr:SLAC1 anion channel family protein [Gammaproteobacteria bacterium]
MTGIIKRLEYFPVSFFSMVMGMAGLTIAWQKMQQVLAIDLSINTVLISVITLVFIILVFMYLTKIIIYREQVINELNNPVKLNFFPAISISLLLLSVAYLPFETSISEALWITGSIMHLMFTLYIVNAWIHHSHFQIQHANPAWFIPAVGNVIVPIAGVPLGYIDVSWFFFSIGMLFWVILLTIIFYRLMFHNPMHEKLMPTLFILIAPPAVGFIAYIRLTADLDSFARILYFSGLFLTLLLLVQAKRFLDLKFYLSWWAYSFPIAAITIASILMYELTEKSVYQYIGLSLLTLLSIIVLSILLRTVYAINRSEICVNED